MIILNGFNFLQVLLFQLPLLFEKIRYPSLVSFFFLKNLRFFSLTSQAKKISVVIDVGANTGQFTHMARYCWPNAKIFAFEPDYSAFCQLKKNHASDINVEPYNYAIGSIKSQLSLNIGDNTTQNSLLKEFGKVSCQSQIVSVDTLDNFFREQEFTNAVSLETILLKVDVQGYELEVLKGATSLLEKTSFVLMEVSLSNLFQDGAKIDDLWRFMEKNRFVYHSVIDIYKDKQSKRILQMDVLFEKN